MTKANSIKRLKRLPHRMEKKEKMRLIFNVAFFVFLFCLPMNAFASLGGYEMYDLYGEITGEIKETNSLFANAVSFATISPFTFIERASNTTLAENIKNSSQSVALVVATLFLCIDFFKKSVNFEWSRSWENVLLFVVKCIVVKVMVTNFDNIINAVYGGFSVVNKTASGISFIPYGTTRVVTVHEQTKGSGLLGWAAYKIANRGTDYRYTISDDAVKFLHPDFHLPTSNRYNSVEQFEEELVDAASYKIFPLFIYLKDQIYFLIMKGIACLTFVQVVGRAFELTVYTILAPLPISTFASEVNCEVGKNFLKKYIACVIQLAVIMAMFVSYDGVNQYIKTSSYSGLIAFATLIALGLGVMKSGAWARSICGTS